MTARGWPDAPPGTGMGVRVAIGVALDEPAVGIAIGASMGAALRAEPEETAAAGASGRGKP